MVNRFLSAKTSIALATLFIVGSAPLAGWAKKGPVTYKSNDSTYQYVATVFDTLQSHWEKQSYEQRLEANSTLQFTLQEDGTLSNSELTAGRDDNGAGKEVLAYLKQHAPFGTFPPNMGGNRLEFNFKLTPGSLQMVSYRVLEDKNKKDSVITYGAPSSPAPAVSSLFYARVVDTIETPKVGKVWENQDVKTSDEDAMNEYVSSVQSRIQDKWQQPGEALSFAPTVAMIQIDRDGSLLSANVKQSSGSKAIDTAILKTISEAGPFTGVPKNVQSLPVTIEYVFEPVVSTVFVEEK